MKKIISFFLVIMLMFTMFIFNVSVNAATVTEEKAVWTQNFDGEEGVDYSKSPALLNASAYKSYAEGGRAGAAGDGHLTYKQDGSNGYYSISTTKGGQVSGKVFINQNYYEVGKTYRIICDVKFVPCKGCTDTKKSVEAVILEGTKITQMLNSSGFANANTTSWTTISTAAFTYTNDLKAISGGLNLRLNCGTDKGYTVDGTVLYNEVLVDNVRVVEVSEVEVTIGSVFSGLKVCDFDSFDSEYRFNALDYATNSNLSPKIAIDTTMDANGNGKSLKLYHSADARTTLKGFFDDADLGKRFKVSLKVYPTVASPKGIRFGAKLEDVSNSNWYSGTDVKYYSVGATAADGCDLVVNTWNTVNFEFTMPSEMEDVTLASLAIDQRYDKDNTTPYSSELYIDDIEITKISSEFYNMKSCDFNSFDSNYMFTSLDYATNSGLSPKIAIDDTMDANGNGKSLKLYHTADARTTLKGFFVKEDLGKTFTVSMKIYPTVASPKGVRVGAKFENATNGNWYSGTDTNYYAVGNEINDELPMVANSWNTVSFEFTLPNSLADVSLICLAIDQRYDNDNTTPYSSELYIDDIVITEYVAPEKLTLPAIFADNMVLQRNKPIPVWGFGGTAGDEITVSIDSTSVTGTVDENGDFYVELPAMQAATNKTLIIKNNTDNTTQEFKNVGIGEVWYCGGQSNMELTLTNTWDIDDLVADMPNVDVRSYKVSVTSSYQPKKDLPSGSGWKIVNTKSVTAIGYIAAAKLYKELNVPIALIECYQGGSAAQAWLSYEKVFAPEREAVYNNPNWRPANSNGTFNSWGCEGRTLWEDYDYYWSIGKIFPTTSKEGTLINGTAGSAGQRFAPTSFYNAMQAPLANYAIAGVMWYQGESQPNARLWEQYNYILYDLISQWREDFKDENLPVMIVQLAPYGSESGREFREIRQVQLDTHKRMDNVQVISTAYEGNIGSTDPSGSIHPATKRPVGERMGNTILATVYGKDIEYSGPEYDWMEVKDNKAILHFTHVADGLKVKDGQSALTGFTISSDGTTFVEATATIKNDTVEVYAEGVTNPVAVNYAFVNYAKGADNTTPNHLGGNLENSINQPAFPFKASLTDPHINVIKFTDSMSKELKALTNADINAGVNFNIEIYELAHNKTTHKVIVALYNGENMETAKVYSTQFNTAGNCIVSGQIQSNALLNNGKIKVFLWDGFDKIQPLSSSMITNIIQ